MSLWTLIVGLSGAEGARRKLLVSLLMALIHAGLFASVPVLTVAALHSVLTKPTQESALWFGLAALAVTALRFPVLSLQFSKSYAAAFELGTKLRQRLLAHMRDLSLGVVRSIESGRLIGMFNDDIKWIEAFLGGGLGLAVSAAATPLLLLLCVYVLNPVSGLILTIGLLVGLPLLALFSRLMRERIDERSARIDGLSSRIGEHFAGMAVLRSFNAVGLADRELKADMDALRRHYRRAATNLTASSVPGLFVIEAAFIVCSIVGVAAVDDGRMSAPILAFVLIIGLSLYNPLLLLLGGSGQYRLAATAADNIARFLALPEMVAGTEQAVASGERGLCFDQVSFRYDGTSEPALDNVSFAAEPGALTAIVGPSGAGKSTVFNLISQFWQAQSGTISIDGCDVSKLPPESLASRVALVTQETIIINDTLRRNLDLGRTGIDDGRLNRALVEARCADFVEQLPEGLDSPAGEEGVRLSGGEKQRVAIARCFLKNAPIVLLDEATSSVDASNARLIQQAVGALTRERTVIVIAHRLSTIVDADKIIVMDKGRIVAEGRHNALLDTSPLYRKLWDDHCATRRWTIRP